MEYPFQMFKEFYNPLILGIWFADAKKGGGGVGMLLVGLLALTVANTRPSDLA